MPNYVTNIVTLHGTDEEISRLLDHIAFDGHPGTFDFNKIIPMPEELDMTEGGITDSSIDAYLSVMNPENHSRFLPNERLEENEFYSAIRAAKSTRPFFPVHIDLSDKRIEGIAQQNEMASPEELLHLGKRYLDNIHEHGAATWYGWRIKNWGTKWNNAPETKVLDEKSGELRFDTAWSMPEPLFTELSWQFPEVMLEVSWADEDLGQNVGMKEFCDGEVMNEYEPEPGSNEAIAFAYEILDIDEERVLEIIPDLSDIIQEARDRNETKRQPSPDKSQTLKTKLEPER